MAGLDINDKVSNKSKDRFKSKNTEADFDIGMDDEDGDIDWGGGGSSSGGKSFQSSGFGTSGGFGTSSGGFGSSGGGFGTSGGFGMPSTPPTGGFGSGFGSSGFGSSGFGSSGLGSGFGNGFGSQQQSRGQLGGTSSEDAKVMEAISVGGKKTFNFFKLFMKSMGRLSRQKNMWAGRRIFYASAALLVFGVALRLLGYKFGLSFVLPNVLTGSFGLFWFWRNYSKIARDEGLEGFSESAKGFGVSESSNDAGFSSGFGGSLGSNSAGFGSGGFSSSGWGDSNSSDGGSGFESSWGLDDSFSLEDSDEDYDDDVFDISADEDDEDTLVSNFFNSTSSSGDVAGKIDAVVEGTPVSRGYLFDFYKDIFAHSTPNYSSFKVLEEGNSSFDSWEVIISQACDALRTKDTDEYPTLFEVKDNVLYYYLRLSKPTWLKNVGALVTEIINILSFDPETGKRNPAIRGVGHQTGVEWHIRVLKGAEILVSLKDMMMANESWVRDVRNKMPVMLGVNEYGETVKYDFKSIHAMLTSGAPRSGKSWSVLNTVVQLAMWSSPKELAFEIYDPKGSISDFNIFKKFPHVRAFASKDDDVLRAIRNLVRVEGARREKVLAEHGVKNINDLRDKCPDIDFPYLYVVIDEIITYSERMDKETLEEFTGLLLELVTRLPSMGIRAILIPHVIKDTVIKKTITDNIPIRMTVKGDASQIEKIAGSKTGAKDFNYILANAGDCALGFGNEPVQYVRGGCLADSNNATDAVIENMAKLLNKLYPKTESRAESGGMGSSAKAGTGFVPSNRGSDAKPAQSFAEWTKQDESEILDEDVVEPLRWD